MAKSAKNCGNGGKSGKSGWLVDEDGFNVLLDGIGNRFRIGNRVKYVNTRRPDLQFKVFEAMNYVREYDRHGRKWVDTIELDNGEWVKTSEVFANVDLKGSGK